MPNVEGAQKSNTFVLPFVVLILARLSSASTAVIFLSDISLAFASSFFVTHLPF